MHEPRVPTPAPASPADHDAAAPRQSPAHATAGHPRLNAGGGEVAAALQALGVEHLHLAIHDASFPADETDVGRGTPYGEGARRFLRYVRALGFNGIQLGPQGQTTLANPSPYDGAVFGRNPLSLHLEPLIRAPHPLLQEHELEQLLGWRPESTAHHAEHLVAWDIVRQALSLAARRLDTQPGHFEWLASELAAWREAPAARAWRARYLSYEAACAQHGGDDWRRWPDPDRTLYAGGAEAARAAVLLSRNAGTARRYTLAQVLLERQHQELHQTAAGLGLVLYGELQAGYSQRDLWAWPDVYLPGYLLGAPPSRTNPEGQPWGYPLLNPRLYHEAEGDNPGRALRLLDLRIAGQLADFDGLRIDHPHGLVCPWVYRADQPEPLHAVQHGARLFSSPDLPDHPALAGFAIVPREGLATDAHTPRHADEWVRELDAAQVARYAVLVDRLVAAVLAHGGRRADIVCEVLSTCPRPLAAVLARHGLGRFRVTQKADPLDPRDVYRSENAAPADWVMAGNHDTPPLALKVEHWMRNGEAPARARYLAQRLAPEGSGREALEKTLSREPGRLRDAVLADLFTGPARNVSMFFADLFGMREIYNRPGVVDPANWTLRVPPDFERAHADGIAADEAPDLRGVLALALRARGGEQDEALARRLEQHAPRR